MAGALLLGGAPERVGSGEARLAGGAERIAALLGDLFTEVLLVGGDPPEQAHGRRVADVAGPRSALRGLVSALEAASAPWVFVAASDLLLLTPDLVTALLAWPAADAVVPVDDEGPHALCALYCVERVLPVARERLAAGELRMTGLLDAVETSRFGPEALESVDPEGRALTSVNTPEELAAAEAVLAAG